MTKARHSGLRDFLAVRYPDVRAFDDAPSRIIGVARFRDSRTLANDAVEIVCARAWKDGSLSCAGEASEIAAATRKHGVFAFLLEKERPYSLRGPCALVESPVIFACVERLNFRIDVVLYGHGRVSNRLLDWLAQASAPGFSLLHLPDYDPTGLNEFTRLRARLGDRVTLHVPADLSDRFAKFSKRSLLDHGNGQNLLRNLRQSPLPDIRSVLNLIEKHNAGMEQEALLLDMAVE